MVTDLLQQLQTQLTPAQIHTNTISIQFSDFLYFFITVFRI